MLKSISRIHHTATEQSKASRQHMRNPRRIRLAHDCQIVLYHKHESKQRQTTEQKNISPGVIPNNVWGTMQAKNGGSHPKIRWFGKGNFSEIWQFCISMLDFWGVSGVKRHRNSFHLTPELASEFPTLGRRILLDITWGITSEKRAEDCNSWNQHVNIRSNMNQQGCIN